MPTNGGGIILDPQHTTAIVAITNDGGGYLSLYSDPALTTPIANPVEITAITGFYVTQPGGRASVSFKSGDVEFAGPGNKPLTYYFTGGSVSGIALPPGGGFPFVPVGVGRPWVDITSFGADPTNTTDSTAAINNAAASVADSSGIAIFMPAGTYKCSGTIDFGGTASGQQRNRRLVFGSGNGTILDFTGATLTSGVRLLNSSDSQLRDFQIKAPSTVTYALNVTTLPNSTERVQCYSLSVNGGANGICVGPDTSNDVSEVTFYGCTATSALNNAWLIGNGTQGNVIDITMVGCGARSSAVGVRGNGSLYSWYGGSSLGNTISDFQQGTPGDGPLVISGVRSESSARFWDGPNTGTSAAMSVVLANNRVSQFTDTGGVVISHPSAIPLSILGGSYVGGPVAAIFNLGFDPNKPLMFTSIGVVTDNPTNPYKNNTTNQATEAAFLQRTIINPIYSNANSASPADIDTLRGTLATSDTSTLNPPVFNARMARSWRYLLSANMSAGPTITNPKVGQLLTILINQNGTGGWTYTWPANCRFLSNAAPVASTAANVSDTVTFEYTGTVWQELSRSIGVPTA